VNCEWWPTRCIPIGDVAQAGRGGLLNSGILSAQAREPIVKITDQIGAEDASCTNGVSLLVGKQDCGWRVARELRSPFA